jgi:DNA-binding LacI/PurR family transcriptional regulator
VAARSKLGKTTIVDIASASGVSVATVSRILNDKPDVAVETRERVLRVMEEIGFAPQSAWRQIRSGRTGLIGMHVPQEFNPPNLRVIMAAALGVEDAGYSINIITRTLSDSELLGFFRSRQVDGMLLLEILTGDHRPSVLRDHGHPFVMIGHRMDNSGLSFADIDIDYGVEVAIEHLIGLGHRAIGFLTFDPVIQDKTYGFTTWALQAYEKACRKYGLAPLACLGGLTIEAMSAAAQEMLRRHPEITAFVTPQEQSAVAVLRAAQAQARRIPVDLSLVAMLSDTSSELATPPLTTISFPADELGNVAARMLLARLEHTQTDPEQTLVRPELSVRGTTCAPREGTA